MVNGSSRARLLVATPELLDPNFRQTVVLILATASIIGLGLGPFDPVDGSSPLLGRLGVVDLHRDPMDLPGVEEVRLFSGYAGWTAGQLETEVAAGGWIVVAAHEEDARPADPEGLWRIVLARQGGMVARLGEYPDEPSLN